MSLIEGPYRRKETPGDWLLAITILTLVGAAVCGAIVWLGGTL